MLRADYDNHPLWDTLGAIDGKIDTIHAAHFLDDLPNLERIRVQEGYVRSFDAVASTRAAFFHPAMLDAVNTVWQQAAAALDQRISSGSDYTSYVAQAADHAESGLLQMAAWPRAYGRGGEVKQMNTLFEELLEAQRASIAALKESHKGLQQEISDHSAELDQKRIEVTAALTATQSELTTVEGQIETQKTTVENAVASSKQAVDALTEVNNEAFDEWKNERETAFAKDFDGLRGQISKRLKDANAEYAALLSAKEKYTKLVSAIAADEVAEKFESEAKWGRSAGIWLYAVGLLLLVGAAVPLILLILENAKDDPGGINWTPIVVRLAIGVLAGSAATVAIRLGSRFISNANSAKRMELELRAIGPFLANVSVPDKVDDAHIELVSKAFGKTYGETGGRTAKEASDETIPVTTASQLIDLAERIAKITPSAH